MSFHCEFCYIIGRGRLFVYNFDLLLCGPCYIKIAKAFIKLDEEFYKLILEEDLKERSEIFKYLKTDY